MTTRLHDYLLRWNLHDPHLLTRSERSDIYLAQRGGETVALKLLTPIGVEDEADGALALRYFDGQGAVRLLEQDVGAHLLEYAGGEELAELVYRGEDAAAAAIIAGVVSALHRPRPGAPIPRLRTLDERFASLFERAARDRAAGVRSIYIHGAEVARELLAHPQDECVLHGDVMHHNIRHHPARGWLAFDAKGLYGERLYDITNAVCNPAGAPELVLSEQRFIQMTHILAEHLGADLPRLRAFVFAYACLSASWPDKPEGSQVQNWFLTVARNAERSVKVM